MNDGARTNGPTGLVVVDKPGGWTSHDIVARVRRLAGTRRVGHAGTLDPMATGVLVLGVGRATRLLGYLALTEKAYTATVRLGEATLTDDAEGEVIAAAPAGGVSEERITEAVAALTGEIYQVPSKVSAVKIEGRRSYLRVRAGEDVELAARPVTVRSFEVGRIRRAGDRAEVDVCVVCSSGTYVRALARDLGAALGVGGHLTSLRRTRVGPYTLGQARTLGQLEAAFGVLPLEEAAAAAFPRRDVDESEARAVAHGGRLPAA
ncbi:MAG: tRNA pseudouridine(55) synthase TruB, partial [Streptomycetales bacterium]